MRIPFLQPARDEPPLRIPVPESVEAIYLIFVRAPLGPPPVEPLPAVASAWVDQHASEPLRSAIREALRADLLQLTTMPVAELPPLPRELLRAGEWGERKLDQATHAVAVSLPDQPGAPRLGRWTALAAARAAARSLSGVIIDPLIPTMLAPETYDQALPEGGRTSVADFILVPYSVGRNGAAWITTKGVSRFGVPELEIRGAPPALAAELMPVINGAGQLVIEELDRQAAEGAVTTLEIGPEVRLDLGHVLRAHSSVAEAPSDPPPADGARGWTTLRFEYRPGRRGDDSFLSLVAPRGFSGDQGVWLHSVITDLVGSTPTMLQVKGDSEAMEAAHLRAVSELPGLKQRFRDGLPPGVKLSVKHGFPAGGQHEYMWIAVETWHGRRIRGRLANEPAFRHDLRRGQAVEIDESEVFDWILLYPDREAEGGYTNRVAQNEGID